MLSRRWLTFPSLSKRFFPLSSCSVSHEDVVEALFTKNLALHNALKRKKTPVFVDFSLGDCTIASVIHKNLPGNAILTGLSSDEAAVHNARKLFPRFASNFHHCPAIFDAYKHFVPFIRGHSEFDIVAIASLFKTSQSHLDDPQRGFNVQFRDSPIDLRYDRSPQSKSLPGVKILNEADAATLANIFHLKNNNTNKSKTNTLITKAKSKVYAEAVINHRSAYGPIRTIENLVTAFSTMEYADSSQIVQTILDTLCAFINDTPAQKLFASRLAWRLLQAEGVLYTDFRVDRNVMSSSLFRWVPEGRSMRLPAWKPVFATPGKDFYAKVPLARDSPVLFSIANSASSTLPKQLRYNRR